MVVIAVLMVTGAFLFIKSGRIFGGDDVESSETIPETNSELNMEIVVPPRQGLGRLDTGEVVYILTGDETENYDESCLIPIEPSWQTTSQGELAQAEVYYYLASSWLDVNGDLYYFDEEGHACTDEYSEGAFDFGFDQDGLMESITYDANYHEPSSTSNNDYPGLVQTRDLRAYMDWDKTLGEYVSIRYKRATESLTYYLGGESNIQYASPYAFDICDGRIYYLALENNENAQTPSIYENMAGKVFCMAPGADRRYIVAEGALGFKVLTDSNQDAVVYYYDGNRIRRSNDLVEDENMVLFTEDADYTVNIATQGKAFLELLTGQRVTVASDAFKAGNFTYELASDGEILGVAEKSTVSTGGYTYTFQNGTAFGVDMFRLIRGDDENRWELISAEVAGRTKNIHYDYSSSCIIAEYEDNAGGGGLLKVTLNGDIDVLTESRVTDGSVELYGISNNNAIYKVTQNDTVEFRTSSISSSSPIAAAVDPITIVSSADNADVEIIGEEPGAPDTEEYDDTVQGQSPPDSADTESGDINIEDSNSGVIVPGGPGSVNFSSNAPG